MTILGFRLGTLLVACLVLSLIIVAVYRLGRPGKASELPPEERLRRLEALRKSLGLRTRTLTYADLEWKITEGNHPGRLLLGGPLCPRCGRRLWGKLGTTWARTLWISVENPCKGCGREAGHPNLAGTSVRWLQNQVLREARQRGGAGSERQF